jgi:hypothetical protein
LRISNCDFKPDEKRLTYPSQKNATLISVFIAETIANWQWEIVNILPRLPDPICSARMTDSPVHKIRFCAGVVGLLVLWQLIASLFEGLANTTSKTSMSTSPATGLPS